MVKQIKLRTRGKDGTLYKVRSVSVRYRGVEPRKEVWISLFLRQIFSIVPY